MSIFKYLSKPTLNSYDMINALGLATLIANEQWWWIVPWFCLWEYLSVTQERKHWGTQNGIKLPNKKAE